MEEASTFPSLPPNFVSLQKLQEQRLQEQEQKKRQQQQEERRLKQEEERNKKVQVEEIKTIPNGLHRKDNRRPRGRGQVDSRSPEFFEIRTMPNGLPSWNRRSQKSLEPKKLEEEDIKTTEEPTDLDKRKAESSEKSANSKSQEPNKVEEEDEEIKITEEPTDLEKLRKKIADRKKEWKMKKGERKQKLKLKEVVPTDCSSGNAAGDRSTEEDLPSLNLTVEIGVVGESKKKVESGKEVNGERFEGGKWGWRKKAPYGNRKVFANSTAEVVKRIGDISVNGDDKKMSRRSTVEMNGGFRGGRSWNPGRRVRGGGGGDANLMWMKKDEITQSNGHY